MTASEFEDRVVSWAKSRKDVISLIEIGSRAQRDASVDEWSDWDFHLVVRNSFHYRKVGWLNEIAPCWISYVEFTERGVFKVTAVFEGGFEVDFVLLISWQMKLVYWAMAHPEWNWLYPRALIAGVANTRLIVCPGYRVLVGDDKWRERLSVLDGAWQRPTISEQQFRDIIDGFWRHAVWVHRKIMRGELRAAQRWLHREVAERRWLLLEEEGVASGYPARPEARKAEQWLNRRRIAQTTIATDVNQRVLADALLAEMTLFEELCQSVAKARAFQQREHHEISAWIRAALTKLV